MRPSTAYSSYAPTSYTPNTLSARYRPHATTLSSSGGGGGSTHATSAAASTSQHATTLSSLAGGTPYNGGASTSTATTSRAYDASRGGSPETSSAALRRTQLTRRQSSFDLQPSASHRAGAAAPSSTFSPLSESSSGYLRPRKDARETSTFGDAAAARSAYTGVFAARIEPNATRGRHDPHSTTTAAASSSSAAAAASSSIVTKLVGPPPPDMQAQQEVRALFTLATLDRLDNICSSWHD